jgi:predicted lipid-binding transport protein (Tim44 family)
MQGNFDLLTIISLVIAVLAILKLRSVLGKRTSDDEARIDRQMRAREAQQRAAAAGEKVVTLPGRENTQPKTGPHDETDVSKAEQSVKEYAKGDSNLAEALLEIHRTNRSFDPNSFMDGARQAYEMIVTAFAEGNRRMLADLLSEDVYAGFAQAIDQREADGHQVDQSFVGINAARIVEAELENGREAQVTVRFVSQLISATRDREGEVINGDPQRVMEVTDIWTFARDITSDNPNWKLISTQAAN